MNAHAHTAVKLGWGSFESRPASGLHLFVRYLAFYIVNLDSAQLKQALSPANGRWVQQRMGIEL